MYNSLRLPDMHGAATDEEIKVPIDHICEYYSKVEVFEIMKILEIKLIKNGYLKP